MSAKTYKTYRFIETSLILFPISAAAILATFILSYLGRQSLLSETVTARPDSPAKLTLQRVPANRLGALRIDVRAHVASDRWITYEVQLRARWRHPSFCHQKRLA